MKTYTKNQVEAIMLKGFHAGVEVGRLPRDRQADIKPPTLEELEIFHPLDSSDDPANMAKKNSWLDGIGQPLGGVPRG